ncbi:MAG: hypothetical protein VKJ24_01825 [Synechococcales bacterium]|nr:hypothetical protein [Synechococcales bacterium]
MLYPPAQVPFRRLRIYDGLSIDADRWQQSHRYHRLRQNFHYQALHQAGILSGLGVAPMADPTAIEGQAQSGRWLKIQPGMAIDAAGNPIIVPEPMSFQIQADIRAGEQQTIYLVVNYVDPDDLRQTQPQDWVQETFRIRETTCLALLDVELCRVTLLPGTMQLAIPPDVMGDVRPGELDLRDRPRVQLKPHVQIKAAFFGDNHVPNSAVNAPWQSSFSNLSQPIGSTSPIVDRWRSFAQALPSLSPQLSIDPQLTRLELADLATPLRDYDLLWLTEAQLKALPTDRYPALRQQLEWGGVCVIQVDPAALNWQELVNVAQELQIALREAEQEQMPSQQQLQLQLELKAIETEIEQKLDDLVNDLIPIAIQLGQPITHSGILDRQHPLRRTPFLFAQLPAITDQPLQILNWGGLVLMIGDLSHNWDLDANFSQSREEIRAAQEFGINLLHFTWQRRDRTSLYYDPTS